MVDNIEILGELDVVYVGRNLGHTINPDCECYKCLAKDFRRVSYQEKRAMQEADREARGLI